MKLLLLAIAGAVALGGCTPRYVQPESGPTAKVRMTLRESSAYFAMLHTYEKPGCEGPQAFGLVGGPGMVNANPENNSRVDMIGSSNIDPRVIEKVIPANRKFTVRYGQIGPHSATTTRSCELTVSFQPRPGGEYEMNYRYDGKGCYVQVLELSLSAAGNIIGTPVTEIDREPAGCKPTKF